MSPFQQRNGVSVATHAVAHLGGVRERNRGIGLQACGEVEPLQRGPKLTVAKIADAQIAHCGGVIGTDGQRQIYQALRDVKSSLLKRDDPEQMVGVEIMWRRLRISVISWPPHRAVRLDGGRHLF